MLKNGSLIAAVTRLRVVGRTDRWPLCPNVFEQREHLGERHSENWLTVMTTGTSLWALLRMLARVFSSPVIVRVSVFRSQWIT